MGLARLSERVGKYVKASSLGSRGGCHLFRHACATHMHENGADIRMIQATHPASKIGKREEGESS